jgi:hypothetical protein
VLHGSRELPIPDALEQESRSAVTIGGHRFFLYAADESVTVEKESTCFADAGARRFAGHYWLFATKKGRTLSSLDLGPLEFAEGRVFDGLRTVDLGGHRVLGIAQYLGCSAKSLRLYRIDRRGTLAAVPIVGPLGADVKSLPIHDTSRLTIPRGPFVFCGFSNAGPSACDAYRLAGERLVWIDGWEPGDDERSWRRPTTQGRARHTASRFLGYVQAHDERRAATLFDGSPEELHDILASCPSGRMDAGYQLDPATRRRGDRYQLTATDFEGDGQYQVRLEVVARGRGFRVAKPPGCPLVSAIRP